jgi:hypothetical protein
MTTLDSFKRDGNDDWSEWIAEPTHYRGCRINASFWPSGNDGCWKDSFKVSYPNGKTADFCYWDDYGAIPVPWNKPLSPADAMPLMEYGYERTRERIDRALDR